MKKVNMKTAESKQEQTETVSVVLVQSVMNQLNEAMEALQKLEPQVAAQKAVVETIVHTALAQAGHDIKLVKGVSLNKEDSSLTFTL